MSTPLYEVFGGALSSEVLFEDLPRSSSAKADWILKETAEHAAPAGEPLGEDVVYGTTRVRGYRTADGFALAFDDTGLFDVSRDGRTITWHRPADVVLDAARADITSRVLALALHANGVFSLHASAVSLPAGGIAFMAPKHHGKSTLCSALVLAGARALSDDTVPVRPGEPPTLVPGLARLRLWSDAAARLFGVEREDESFRKHLMDHLDASQVETRPVPFRAVYLLFPSAELADGAAAVRTPLDAVSATIALLAHAKLGPVLTGSEAPVMLALASNIARAVPVYSLQVVRDLERIGEVAEVIQEWHATAPGIGVEGV